MLGRVEAGERVADSVLLTAGRWLSCCALRQTTLALSADHENYKGEKSAHRENGHRHDSMDKDTTHHQSCQTEGEQQQQQQQQEQRYAGTERDGCCGLSFEDLSHEGLGQKQELRSMDDQNKFVAAMIRKGLSCDGWKLVITGILLNCSSCKLQIISAPDAGPKQSRVMCCNVSASKKTDSGIELQPTSAHYNHTWRQRCK